VINRMSNRQIRRLTATLVVLALVVSLVVNLNNVYADIFGDTNIESYEANDYGYIDSTKFNLAVAGTVKQISLYIYSPTNARVAIYDDDGSGGDPGTLLVESASEACSAGAWHTFSVTPTYLAAGDYYLAFQHDAKAIVVRHAGVGTGTSKYRTYTYGAFPNPFGTASSGTVKFSIYATYSPITITTPTMYTVTFNTDPASVGSISADGATKTNGATGTYASGTRVHVVANPPGGYTFSYWQTSGVSVDSTSSQDTYMTVSNNGWLKAYFTPIVPDFSIRATPTSQSVAAGATASFTLNLEAYAGFSGTVSLSVTSGAPPGVTCTITPSSISTFPGTATLYVPTLITTSGTYSTVVTATSATPAITHTVTVTLIVSPPPSYSFNVKAGATQIVVTLTYTWTGSGAPPLGSITIAGPGGTPTLQESAAVTYDRTSISVSGTTTTYSIIHRATFTITAPGSTQTWTALISILGVSNYNVAIEVS